MHAVVTKDVRIYRNARIAQMVFFVVHGEATLYAGTYLEEDVLTMGRRGTQEKLDDMKRTRTRRGD